MFPTRSVEFYQALFDEDLYPYASTYSWTAVNKTTLEQNPLCDQRTLRRAKTLLNELTNGLHGDQPFFMAVGFSKTSRAAYFPRGIS